MTQLTATLTAGCVQVGDELVLSCGGVLSVDRWEAGPAVGEISLYMAGERYIFASDAPMVSARGRVCRSC